MDNHEGTFRLRSRLSVPYDPSPASKGLSQYAARLLFLHSTLLALGILVEEDAGRPTESNDSEIVGEGWPWCTILTSRDVYLTFSERSGEMPNGGVTEIIVGGCFGVNAHIAAAFTRDRAGIANNAGSGDPVVDAILSSFSEGNAADARAMQMAALGIDLERRDRVKVSGKILGADITGTQEETRSLRMGVLVERSMGNCPKYLNKKHILPHQPQPTLISASLPLPQAALNLLSKVDMFFMTSSNHSANMSTNHRGGPPGFVRVAHNTPTSEGRPEAGTILVYPEYSGNRLYQTLGNLESTPRAGFVFPDFDTADALFVTGATEIVEGKDAAVLMPRSNLAVKIHVHAARFVKNVLAFTAVEGERSPYNPAVRYLTSERASTATAVSEHKLTAALLSRTLLTPNIARFRFGISDPAAATWHGGQYAAFDFSEELFGGYAHMRDDDPQSLNDDFVRTFTVSSPGSVRRDGSFMTANDSKSSISDSAEFEITIRNVGTVTNFLFKQNIRAGLEVPLKGFGGSFHVDPELVKDGSRITPFVAGGIGITPLLAQFSELKMEHLRLYWSIHRRDAGLVTDTMERFPLLMKSTRLFVSGMSLDEGARKEISADMSRLKRIGLDQLVEKRIERDDLQLDDPDLSSTWYLCTGPALRKDVLTWLGSRRAIYEDFDY